MGKTFKESQNELKYNKYFLTKHYSTETNYQGTQVEEVPGFQLFQTTRHHL